MASVTARRTTASGFMSAGLVAALVVGSGVFAAVAVAVAPASPLVPVAVAAGLAAVALAIANPVLMIYIGILSIPAEGQFDAPIGPSQAALGLAAAGWLVRWAVSRPVTLPRHAALAAFAVLLIANAAGWPGAPEPVGATRLVVNWTVFLILAVALAHSATERQIVRLLFVFAVFGGILGAAAIVDPQPLTAPVFGGGLLDRATGGFGSPNALGMMLVMTIPIQIVFVLRGTRTEQVVALGCVLLALVAMTLAVSRGAFVALAAAVVLMGLWGPFRRTAMVVLPLVIVLAVLEPGPATKVFNTDAVVERLSSTKETGTTDPRIFVWRKAPSMIADRPIFGMGPLQYGHYTASYGIGASQGVLTHAHNLFINATVEAGLVGGLALVWMFAAVGIGLGRTIRRTSGMTQAMAFALLASLGGFFVNGFLDYALAAAEVAAVFFLLVGCAVALTLRSAEAARSAA